MFCQICKNCMFENTIIYGICLNYFGFCKRSLKINVTQEILQNLFYVNFTLH